MESSSTYIFGAKAIAAGLLKALSLLEPEKKIKYKRANDIIGNQKTDEEMKEMVNSIMEVVTECMFQLSTRYYESEKNLKQVIHELERCNGEGIDEEKIKWIRDYLLRGIDVMKKAEEDVDKLSIEYLASGI